MKLKKILAVVCSVVMVASTMVFSTASVSAENPYKDMVFEVKSGKNAMSSTARLKSNYIVVAMNDIGGAWDSDYTSWSGKFVKSGALRIAVKTGILSDVAIVGGSDGLYNPNNGAKASSNFTKAFATNYKNSGYDLITIMWAAGDNYGMTAEDNAELVELQLMYSDKSYSDDITIYPYEDSNDTYGYSYISFCDIYGADIENGTAAQITGLDPEYTYTLSGTSSTVTATKKSTSGDDDNDTTPIIGGNADRDAAEAFTDYAEATAVGKYEGVTSDDQATAFWAELKNGTETGEQATTGNIVWKVTSNGTSKYFKKSVGNAIAGGGSAKVGLIVQNLYDDNATAGIAFLQ